ncbi:Uncharacterized conserved protein, DUF1330 family [Rhizobium sp. NFR07]|uniref:DUF1330 domain-containing protein n=1 Tax=Rhizobium sp. NFR07 TaxID=1566262 RepID=UPI0008F3AF22|nr:DUF1330 domain-containing protein [Rhizobium sp. NFR07]SFB63864.1 Uncharacterized conserved protein, DUF1330 family [Rhizobium sp. NFR07]
MVAFSPDVFTDFLAEEDGAPIVMLNLIRFLPDGGHDRHLEYLRMAEPILARFGARILFRGDGLDVLTTGDVKGWDAVLLVQYPRRTAFKEMVEDPEYQAALQVGKSALADIILQPLKISKDL